MKITKTWFKTEIEVSEKELQHLRYQTNKKFIKYFAWCFGILVRMK